MASEQDIDTAMRLGVNYPYGPACLGSATWLAANIKAPKIYNITMAKNAIAHVHVATPTSASGERL
ncbi:hypothetical protein OIU92_28790 [Escherichia coli]|nr:hypothetical protein [Escherichia coli]